MTAPLTTLNAAFSLSSGPVADLADTQLCVSKLCLTFLSDLSPKSIARQVALQHKDAKNFFFWLVKSYRKRHYMF